MRIDRIELATPNDRVELRFHPQVTVVTGLGRLEREALSNEVLGAIGSGRAGLSVDVVADDGRCLEIQRPLVGPATVRDAVSCEDFTERFLQGESVDLLGSLGISRSSTRELLHFSERNLRSIDDVDSTIGRLAAIDQDRLWTTAIRMAEIEVEMASIIEEEIVDDPLAVHADAIEHAHAERDLAADELDRARSQSFVGSAALLMIGLAVGLITIPWLAIPFLVGAGGMAAHCWQKKRDYEAAAAAENEVLAQAGIASYLNFQMKKVDELTADNQVRSRSLELAELHRHSRERWEATVGPGVTLEWAAAHRPEITAAAARLEGSSDAGYPKGHAAECLARVFVAARGAVGETVPLLVDEPFTGLDDTEMLEVQNALATYAPHMQFVIMSNDLRTLHWARERAAAELASVISLGQGLTMLGTEPGHETSAPNGTPSVVRSAVAFDAADAGEADVEVRVLH